ncbi:MAG: Fe(2+) transporter FeoB [Fimbriimonadaceae bacterium]|nr:Fe(2+) transporter FeoB [Fimbriimonadaceae bacterium]
MSAASKPGSSPSTRHPVVALVGNPNSGKTSLFNALTGLNQKVGNYPGVTVEKVSAKLTVGARTVDLIDVPGLYSLKAISPDETVAAQVVAGHDAIVARPDLLVVVLDATNLERNLFLLSQLADFEYPMVVALTMTDMLDKDVSVDVDQLARLLGVTVIPVVAHKGVGLEAIKRAIDEDLIAPRRAARAFRYPRELEAHVSEIEDRCRRIGLEVERGEIRQAFLIGSGDFATALKNIPDLHGSFEAARQELQERGLLSTTLDVKRRYDWASRVRKAVLPEGAARRANALTDKIDRVLIHRVYGLVIFIGIMYGVFQAIYTFAGPLMDGIDWLFGSLGDLVRPQLGAVPWLESLLVDGLLTGIGGVLMFLPQIAILFLLISILEGSGYLARAAFLMDRLLGWCGLNGRAFVPLLSSYACAIPGIMATRVMPDRGGRLATILVAPLMSCSARLPVYILLIGTFIQPKFGVGWAGFALFAMHLVGLVVAIPVAWIINRGIIRGKRLPFYLELPSYQWPKWRDVLLAVYFRAKLFVTTAGTIIVVMSLLIWALLYFPRSDEATAQYRQEYASLAQERRSAIAEDAYVQGRQIEYSALGRFGRFIEPAFVPAGFDWRLTTGILAAFPAREVVVPSLGIIFQLGGEVDEASGDLRLALQRATWPDGRPLLTPWNAIGLMVFFALCCQCTATLATVKQETKSWKWPAFMFAYMTALAYLAAVAINQIGLALT